MAYSFTDSHVASVVLSNFGGTSGNNITIPNVNGELSADSLVAGVQQYLNIFGVDSNFDVTEMKRIITQNVVET